MRQARLRVLLLMLMDMVVISAIWVAFTLMCSDHARVGYFIKTRGGFALVYLAFNAMFGLYHGNPLYPGMTLSPMTEFKRISCSTLVTGLVFFTYLSVSQKSSPSPAWVVLLAAAMNMVLAQSARNFIRRQMARFDALRIPIVIVGGSELAKAVSKQFDQNPHYGTKVAGVFFKTEDAIAFGAEHNVSHCVCCQPVAVFREAIWRLMGKFQRIAWLGESRLFPIATSTTLDVGGFGGVEMSNQPLQHGMLAIKRMIETVFAAAAFLMLIVPSLLICLVLGISGGFKNVFYKAERIGKNGRKFNIYKFRTMRVDADDRLKELLESDPKLAQEWKLRQKLDHDPRITCIGRFLRLTSLDELPQFINIFRGEMSLIGPRPITAKEIPRYGKDFEIAFRIKPGISGLWQVSGRSEMDYATRARLDTYYSLNWSMWMDIWILLRTVTVVLRMRGAK